MDKIFEYFNGNPVIAGMFSLWALGVCTFLLRNVPLKMFAFFVKHCTTEMTFNSPHPVFYSMLNWLDKKGYAPKARKIKISNGAWGGGKTMRSVGYGTHLIFIGGHPVLLQYDKETNSFSDYVRENIVITKLGRSHKMFDDILVELNKKDAEDNKNIEVFAIDCGDWGRGSKQRKRSLDTIIMNGDIIDRVKNALIKFQSEEEWYLKHGIPYQLGILLHGEPGTGKTSLIKGIASYLNYNIFSLNLRGDLFKLINSVPEKSVIVIEDVDCDQIVGNREDNKIETKQIYSLSTILNAIDGLRTVDGRILIMTTNYPERIDAALIRPGRIDLNINISYLNDLAFKQFINRFYEKDGTENGFYLSNKQLTGAMLQCDILSGLSKKEILIKYCGEIDR